jgi:hypothetical protein
MLRNCDRERRIVKYFNTRHPANPADVDKMTNLMMRLDQREFDHVMKVRVELDKSPGHLLCYCSGDKPHRLKDCSKVPGGSKCRHRITKGKNKGGYKKKSSCPECCPKNFCPHNCRRDNCQKCKLKGKGQSSRFKDKCLQGSIVKVEDLHQTPMVHPGPSIDNKEDQMTVVDLESYDSDYFREDPHIVQGPSFKVQGLDIDEDIEEVEDFPLDVLQDDHDDVQHVPFLVEGSHF